MRYLVWFAQTHLYLRWSEFDAVLEVLGVVPHEAYQRPQPSGPHGEDALFIVVDLPSEEAAIKLQSRTILIKLVIELWAIGRSYEELVQSLESYPAHLKAPHFSPSVSWSVAVEGVCRTLSVDEQEAGRRQVAAHLPFEGPVRIKQPVVRLWLLELHRLLDHRVEDCTPLQICLGRELLLEGLDGARVDDGDDTAIRRSVARAAAAVRGRKLGVRRCLTARDLVGHGDLKKRAYLGPTSLQPELGLIMANLGKVKGGSMVLDPFVGTASILTACAHFGALCTGTDIDIRVLKGKGGRNIFSNFEQYGLPPPELIRSDASIFCDQFRVLPPMWDAVITDPPYGIRAGARRCGSRRDHVKAVADHQRADHIPQTRPYPMNEVLEDLLATSAKILKPGGRLVYLLPWHTSPDNDPDAFHSQYMPTNPLLTFIAVCDQPITTKFSRKIVVMERLPQCHR